MSGEESVRGRRLGRLLGFLLLPIVGTVTPLVLYPVVTRILGATGWSDFAVGQSVGMAVSIVVELGWFLNGPQMVARAEREQQIRLLWEARFSKFMALLIVALPVFVAASLLAPDRSLGAGWVGLGYAASGLSQAWYFVGRGEPWRSLLGDSMTRLLGTLVASLVIFETGQLSLAGIVLILFSILGQVSSGWLAGGRRNSSGVTIADAARAMRSQFVSVLGRSVSSIYTALPISLVSLVAPGSVAAFAALERMMRMGLSGMQAIPTMMQADFATEFGEGDSSKSWKVALRAVGVNVALGVVGGAVLATIGPFVVRMVFSGVADPPRAAFILAGGVVVITSTSRATGGLVLVGLDMIGKIARSACVGAIVGLTIIPLCAHWIGATGGFVGELVAELLVLFVQGRQILKVKSNSAALLMTNVFGFGYRANRRRPFSSEPKN